MAVAAGLAVAAPNEKPVVGAAGVPVNRRFFLLYYVVALQDDHAFHVISYDILGYIIGRLPRHICSIWHINHTNSNKRSCTYLPFDSLTSNLMSMTVSSVESANGK